MTPQVFRPAGKFTSSPRRHDRYARSLVRSNNIRDSEGVKTKAVTMERKSSMAEQLYRSETHRMYYLSIYSNSLSTVLHYSRNKFITIVKMLWEETVRKPCIHWGETKTIYSAGGGTLFRRPAVGRLFLFHLSVRTIVNNCITFNDCLIVNKTNPLLKGKQNNSFFNKIIYFCLPFDWISWLVCSCQMKNR